MNKAVNTKLITCNHCGSKEVLEYCANCGQKQLPSTLTTKALLWDALDNILNISKQVAGTLKTLLLHPQLVVDAYLSGNRKQYVNPFRFLLIVGALTVALFLVLQPYFKSNIFINEEDQYGVISIVFFTLFTKLFYYKSSFAKCLIAIIYVLCFAVLVFSPILFLISIATENQAYLMIYFVILLAYIIRSFIKIFKQNPFLTALKVLLIFVLTNLVYSNFLLLIRQ
jgi:hypothetical protein